MEPDDEEETKLEEARTVDDLETKKAVLLLNRKKKRKHMYSFNNALNLHQWEENLRSPDYMEL